MLAVTRIFEKSTWTLKSVPFFVFSVQAVQVGKILFAFLWYLFLTACSFSLSLSLYIFACFSKIVCAFCRSIWIFCFVVFVFLQDENFNHAFPPSLHLNNARAGRISTDEPDSPPGGECLQTEKSMSHKIPILLWNYSLQNSTQFSEHWWLLLYQIVEQIVLNATT